MGGRHHSHQHPHARPATSTPSAGCLLQPSPTHTSTHAHRQPASCSHAQPSTPPHTSLMPCQAIHTTNPHPSPTPAAGDGPGTWGAAAGVVFTSGCVQAERPTDGSRDNGSRKQGGLEVRRVPAVALGASSSACRGIICSSIQTLRPPPCSSGQSLRGLIAAVIARLRSACKNGPPGSGHLAEPLCHQQWQ